MKKGTDPDKSKRYQSLEELGTAVKLCINALERKQVETFEDLI